MAAMGTRDRPIDRARRVVGTILTTTATDLREARITAGLSQRAVAEAAGVSHPTVSRIERGTSPEISLLAIARIGAAVGLKPVLRLYPDGDPIRDIAHVKLLERLHARIHPQLRWRTEVPLPIPGDPRAWDATIAGMGFVIGVEAETRIRDAQAVARRTNLKQRDGQLDHVVLLVAGTRSNRRALVAAGPGLATAFPVSQRDCLRALRDGRDPGGSSIIVL
jgi:transcriptional regulator with XRE-family HTH domain